MLVTDVDGTAAPSSADHPHPFSDGDSDPLATRQDLPSAPPSAMTSDPNHEAPSSALGPAASIGPNAEEHDEEDLALAATNAAVLAPTTDPGAPQSSVQPSEATLRAAHVDSADSMHAGSMHTGSMHTEPQRAGLVWDEEAHYEAETRVIPDAERQLRNAGLLRDDLTETSAVVPAWEQPRRRSRWALLMAAVLGAAGSTVVAWLLRSPPPEPAAATSTVEEAANEPSLSEPNSDSEQSEELKASTADEQELAPKPSSEATPEPASASSTPPEIRATSSKRHSAKKHPAKARPTPPPKQSPRPVRDKPKLATSPYGEPKSGQ